MLTVACLWIKGRGKRAYTLDYVTRLRSMVARHLTLPHHFVCMTDTPELLPDWIQPAKIKRPKKLVPWWCKLKLFKEGMWHGRVLYLDLDVIVTGSLDPIAKFPAPFALLPDMAPTFQGNPKTPHLKIVHRYNSSVMVLDAGSRPNLWADWEPSVAYRLRSDQDWIGEKAPDEATFPREWFERLYPTTTPPFPPEQKVLLAIKLKNQKAEKTLPWVADYWR